MEDNIVYASLDLLKMLLEYARQIGLKVEAVLDHTGISHTDLKGPLKTINANQFKAACDEVARKSGDDLFGLHWIEKVHHLNTGGILSTLAKNCATLGEALEKLVQYHDLMANFAQISLKNRGDFTHIIIQSLNSKIIMDSFLSQTVLCELTLTLRDLVGDRLKLVEARFPINRPVSTSELAAFFGCPLCFGQPDCRLVMRRKDLNLSMPIANPELLNRLEEIAQELLRKRYAAETWAAKVNRTLVDMLQKGRKPSLELVARVYAVSSRKLQMYLQDEQTSYRQIFNQMRKELSKKLLKDSESQVCEISLIMGFSDQSAFNHAFKRWTGFTPGEYRKSFLSS